MAFQRPLIWACAVSNLNRILGLLGLRAHGVQTRQPPGGSWPFRSAEGECDRDSASSMIWMVQLAFAASLPHPTEWCRTASPSTGITNDTSGRPGQPIPYPPQRGPLSPFCTLHHCTVFTSAHYVFRPDFTRIGCEYQYSYLSLRR